MNRYRLAKYYPAICPECGWKGSSELCYGGHYMADDYPNCCECPKCGAECDEDIEAKQQKEQKKGVPKCK